MEKYRGRKELHCFFADLEKAYDRTQERNCGTARGSLVAEKHVRVLQDMSEDSSDEVYGRSHIWVQGSALHTMLFAMVMYRLTNEVKQESQWTIMLTDDTVICGESREQVIKSPDRCRYALEKRRTEAGQNTCG